MSARPVRTTCPYCGVGCGVLATAQDDGTAAIEGDPAHPANFGRLCSKGMALGETLSLDDRLLYPLVHGERVSWDRALDTVAARFRDTIAEHGPDAVAFYVSGQLLTEDYYVANKLMKGFIGSANIDTNSRLCMASSVAGHKRAFGSDTVPGTYEDLEIADLVVLVGSNLAWCHPVLHQRLASARGTRGTKVVVIDPRETATCDIADLHLQLAPGSDVALFNGLLAHLAATGKVDRNYVAKHTNGFAAALDIAQASSIAGIARRTGLAPSNITAFYELFASVERAVTVFSQGVNQSSAGTDKVNAIINCHLATGRIGKPGMGPFSVTGQPNAMGGRETGGLANMLAAHMELENPEHRRLVQSFWGAPALAARPGLKAVDLFRAVGDGRIKAIWIMATNPVDSMPEADTVRAALAACPFVAVSDVARHTDTTALAHVLLPASAWGEKDGTVTNSERRISRQRRFLGPPGEARPDWWQLCEVAKHLGFGAAFAYESTAEIFAEYARLTAFENEGTRDLDLGAHSAITPQDYDGLEPFQWPQPAGSARRESRFFADGRFYTPDGKARFVATPFRLPASKIGTKFPLSLNTGRIRDQWHTMTRTAKTPRLVSHVAEPFLDVHPNDAEHYGLEHDHLAVVRSRHGEAVFRVSVTKRQPQGSMFAPMHWTDQLASKARVDALMAGNTDPLSGQPELKHAAVAVTPFVAGWYGLAVTKRKPSRPAADYWVLAPAKGGWRLELAGIDIPAEWGAFAGDLLSSVASEPGDLLAYHDRAVGQHRFALFEGEQLAGVLFAGREPVAVPRTWASELLTASTFDPGERLRLLAGRPGNGTPDRGAVVCACFEVGLNQIVEAVTTGACLTVDQVGAALRAGTNCGSCRSDIRRIIDESRLAKAG